MRDAFRIGANYNQPMGTSGDWISVLLEALWCPGFMLLGVWILKGNPQIRPILTPLYLLSSAFAGLFFGIWSTFGWNAFRWPLVSLLLGSAAGIVAFGKLAQRKLRSGPNVTPPTVSG
jgi:hypothetical protein